MLVLSGMCDGAGGCQFVDLWLGSAHLLSGHRANFANPRLAETTETTGQIGAGIENTHDQPSPAQPRPAQPALRTKNQLSLTSLALQYSKAMYLLEQ